MEVAQELAGSGVDITVVDRRNHHLFRRLFYQVAGTSLSRKSLEDATTIRRGILLSFEDAERETDPERCAALQTFVIIGGGLTGVELAGQTRRCRASTTFS